MARIVDVNDRPHDQTTAYFTMLSIIQGIAFGALMLKVSDHASLSDWRNLYGLLLVVSFFTLCMTWHEYARSATRISWHIDWRDSFIPFILGAGQVVACSATREPTIWLVSFAVWTAAGFAAYRNSIRHIRTIKDDPLAGDVATNFEKCSVLSLAAGVSCVGIYYAAGRFAWWPWLLTITIGLVLALTVLSITFEARHLEKEKRASNQPLQPDGTSLSRPLHSHRPRQSGSAAERHGRSTD